MLVIAAQLTAYTQTPGLLVRPAGTAGPLVLDPNADGYTSATASPQGFTANDITSSEIPYKLVPALVAEPTGDLLRGPDGKYSDIVKTFDGSGFYLFSSAGNLLTRIRMGGIVSGSKGYSILLDTDQKFGATGPAADPNFRPRTNGNNGNPGFEFEVVYETNFRVAIYNVDGTSTPVFVTSYLLTTNAQISVAATRDGGNPDYFYDFFVPLSAMGLTVSSPLRAIATTVMSPGPAIGGPKSDIYGVGSGDYMNNWTDVITSQPSFTPANITSAGTGLAAFCTNPPVINTTAVTPTTTVINISWTKTSYSTVSNASVQLFNGAAAVGSPISIASGGNANFTVAGLASGNVLTARATATGESTCLFSNAVRVNACNAATHTAVAPVTAFACNTIRGFQGDKIANASVKLYKVTAAGGYQLFADDATTPFLITYPDGIAGLRWRYDDANSQSGQTACAGGAPDVDNIAAAFAFESLLAPSCASVPSFVCAGGTAAPATPIITSLLTDGATRITGTTVASAAVNLFINGYFSQSVTSDASGNYTFTLTTPLATGQQVEINAATNTSCASAFAGRTISCYIAAPIINSNALRQVAIGSQLTGSSAAPLNTTITILDASTLTTIGTTTTAANGNWTLTTPTVAAGITYVAQITGSACGNSALSPTAIATAGTPPARCGTITGPVLENASAVAGTITTAVLNTTVTLLADGEPIGSLTTGGTTWSIPVNTTAFNIIYPGAVLTITITEPARISVTCAATQTVQCVPPASPSVTPAGITNISVGQTATFTIASTVSGTLYSLTNNATSTDLGGSKFGNGSSQALTTTAFNTPGTYNVDIKASTLSGDNCAGTTSRQVVVTGVLPVTLTDFSGKLENGIVKLYWQTSFEQGIQSYEIERKTDIEGFKKIGSVAAIGNSQLTTNYHFDDVGIKGSVFYYRLRIIDNTTTETKYSKTLTFKAGKGIVVSPVTPNPFESSLNIKLEMVTPENIVLRLFDMVGRPVRVQNFAAKKGSNNFICLGLDNLASGFYIIELSAGGESLLRQQLMKK